MPVSDIPSENNFRTRISVCTFGSFRCVQSPATFNKGVGRGKIMTKIYALRNHEGKTVSHVTLKKYSEETIAIVACNKAGKTMGMGYIALLTVDGISLCAGLTKDAHIERGNKGCIETLSTR